MRTMLLAALVLVAAFSGAEAKCVIVVSSDRSSTEDIYWHEIAHCNGWTHPEQSSPQNYQAFIPLKEFLGEYDGHIEAWIIPTWAAQEMCRRKIGKAAYGCQWFE